MEETFGPSLHQEELRSLESPPKKKMAGCAEPCLAKSRDHSGMSSQKKMEFGIISDLGLNVHPRLRRTKKLPWR